MLLRSPHPIPRPPSLLSSWELSRISRREIADEARRHFALALSDHLTLLKAYDGWKLSRGCGSRAEREYLRDHFLSRQTLVMVEDMRRQFCGLLRDIGFIEGRCPLWGLFV